VGLVYGTVKSLFCWRTGIVSAALVAVSPLLVNSAGASVSPHALDLFLCALVMYTFVRLFRAPGRASLVFHGLALAGALYANFFMVALLFMEALFLLLHFKVYRAVWFSWIWSACIAFLLFCPWFPVSGKQMPRMYGHDDLVTEHTALRVSCLMTELSMGRLYAWYPLTPVLSLLPAPSGETGSDFGRLYPEGRETRASVIQAVQTGCMGGFFLLAVLGVAAAMRITGFSLVTRQAEVLQKIRDNRGGCPVCGNGGIRDTKHGAALLILYFLGPLAMALILSWMRGGSFEGSELIFIALPFLILVARGVGALEWRPMFYGFLGLIVLMSVGFSFLTRGLEGITQGSRAAAAFLEARREEGAVGAVVHDRSLTYYPLLFYTKGDLEEVTYFEGRAFLSALGSRFLKPGTWLSGEDVPAPEGPVWRVDIDPPGDSIYAHALDYFDALSGGDGSGEGASFHESSAGWAIQDTKVFGNLRLTRYERKNKDE
jgi:hypothetical protein